MMRLLVLLASLFATCFATTSVSNTTLERYNVAPGPPVVNARYLLARQYGSFSKPLILFKS
jgi:hypothetical protein